MLARVLKKLNDGGSWPSASVGMLWRVFASLLLSASLYPLSTFPRNFAASRLVVLAL